MHEPSFHALILYYLSEGKLDAIYKALHLAPNNLLSCVILLEQAEAHRTSKGIKMTKKVGATLHMEKLRVNVAIEQHKRVSLLVARE